MSDRRPAMNQFQRDDFVDLIRNGKLRYDACNQLNLTVRQVKSAYLADPNFRADLDEALSEANEPVENALYVAAKAGEPWATKMWLERREKERWGEAPKQVQVVHELDGSALLDSVATLTQQLEERRMQARAIETGGKLIEIEPAPKEKPYIYEPGKAPVFHSIATHNGQLAAAKKAKKAAEALPKRPGTS